MLSLRKDKNYSMTRQINDNVDRPEKSSGQVEPMTFKSSVWLIILSNFVWICSLELKWKSGTYNAWAACTYAKDHIAADLQSR